MKFSLALDARGRSPALRIASGSAAIPRVSSRSEPAFRLDRVAADRARLLGLLLERRAPALA